MIFVWLNHMHHLTVSYYFDTLKKVQVPRIALGIYKVSAKHEKPWEDERRDAIPSCFWLRLLPLCTH